MINKNDIIIHRLQPAELQLCQNYAKLAEIGGISQIRAGKSRSQELSTDQLIGQIGQYVGTCWLTGNQHQYQLSRWVANQYPYSGDGGTDILGANVDFKASRLSMSRPISEHHLLVRPAERKKNYLYILILVDLKNLLVYLVGWASEADLPQQVEIDGQFLGAYKLIAKNLNQLMPLRWFASSGLTT